MLSGARIRALLAALACCQGVAVAGATTLIENVQVIAMTGEGAPVAAAVLVDDGVITSVGDLAAMNLPSELTRIDGNGGYLIPGLTDMHNHIDGPESLKLQLAYGVTTIRNMWGSDEILAQRSAERSGELLAPDIETVSPLIDNDPPYFKGSLTITDASQADAFVQDLKAQGYSALKTYELVQEDVYRALADAADRHGMTIEGHVPQAVNAFDAVRLGHDTMEHSMRVDAAIVAPGIPYSSRFRPLELVKLVARIDAGELTYEDAFSRERLRELAQSMARQRTALVPTMGVYEILSYAAADRAKMAEHPLIEYVSPLYRAFWLQENPGEEMTNDGVRTPLTNAQIASLEYFDSTEHGKWVGVMHEEGVLILAGVDAPNPGMFQGYSLHDELDHMVNRAGLNNYEALKTATVNPAIYWGIEGQRGVIAPGAEADLILLGADPLQDIANTKKIRGVMADGQWLPRERLDALLAEVHEAYEAMAAESEAESGPESEADAEPASGFPVHLYGHH